ncbi:MAG: hypothetical protein QOF78_1664 [Phycisphaerales bacterium]|jgi:hypothetical protein|nr:hypothetical protein [Phycisphaerales bacterium]
MNRVSAFSVVSVISVVQLAFCNAATFAQQSKWTLTSADFRSKQVDLATIDDKGATFGDGSVVGFNDLLLLEREIDPKQQQQPPGGGGGKFVLYLIGGDQFRGEPVKLDGETLHWSSPAVGNMQVPLRQVTALARATPQGAQTPPATTEERRTEDLIVLSNGDTVRGIVSNISPEHVTVRAGGNETLVPVEGTRSVMFAATAGAATSKDQRGGRTFRIRLEDGSVITAPRLRTAAGDTLVVTLADKSARNLPLSSVASIEQLNGPVSWLSSRAAAENVQTPLLDTPRPARMDRSVTGKPIRFGERAYARGIGVAPYSRLTWNIDPATRGDYQTFRTQYAMEGAGQYADVTVRIKLDDRVVHEKQTFTASELSPVVLVPLGSAKSLTLEVDFGGNYGVQDRFNWIEPALVKGSGAPPAPTVPSPSAATTRAAQ